MKRLLPFRSYSEHNVIGMFALDDAQVNDKVTDTSTGDDGVFVKIKSMDLNEKVDVGSNAFQGKTNYPYVYDNLFHSCPYKVEAAEQGDIPFAMTLLETAKTDEHGDNLTRVRPDKRESLQVVVPGETTKLVRKGLFTLSSVAVDGDAPATNDKLKISATAGKIEKATPGVDDAVAFGLCLGVATRASQTGITDRFEGDTYLVSFDFG